MPIADWPVLERPREKLLARGAASLSDAELLAIFLRTGLRGLTAVDLARELLGEHGGLRRLLDADHRALELRSIGDPIDSLGERGALGDGAMSKQEAGEPGPPCAVDHSRHSVSRVLVKGSRALLVSPRLWRRAGGS